MGNMYGGFPHHLHHHHQNPYLMRNAGFVPHDLFTFGPGANGMPPYMGFPQQQPPYMGGMGRPMNPRY